MNSKVSVTECRHHGRKMWRVRWHDMGRVRRKFFEGRAAADSHAANLRGDVLTTRQRIAGLPDAELQTLLAAYDESKKRGINILAAIAEARGHQGHSVSLRSALDELIKEMDNSGTAKPYRSNSRQILSRFIKGRESLPVDNITLKDVQIFIDSFKLNSRPTIRARLSIFFKFCIPRGYCAANPCAALRRIRIKRAPRALLSHDQVKDALKWLDKNPAILAWFILSTFAGLRPEEAQKTGWPMLNFKEGWIRVEEQTSKVGERRVVYPMPNVMAKLKEAKKISILPLNKKKLKEGPDGNNGRNALRAKLGFEHWPKDITRHTAASMWLATSENTASVAKNLGHSEEVLHRHYKALVTRIEAQKFWALL